MTPRCRAVSLLVRDENDEIIIITVPLIRKATVTWLVRPPVPFHKLIKHIIIIKRIKRIKKQTKRDERSNSKAAASRSVGRAKNGEVVSIHDLGFVRHEIGGGTSYKCDIHVILHQFNSYIQEKEKE